MGGFSDCGATCNKPERVGGHAVARGRTRPTSDRLAAAEGVASEAGVAAAHGRVVDDGAAGVGAARAGARVPAALVHARAVAGALRVDGALGPAVGRRADVVGQAGAGGAAAPDLALGVRAARRRAARVDRFRGRGLDWRVNQSASQKKYWERGLQTQCGF